MEQNDLTQLNANLGLEIPLLSSSELDVMRAQTSPWQSVTLGLQKQKAHHVQGSALFLLINIFSVCCIKQAQNEGLLKIAF